MKTSSMQFDCIDEVMFMYFLQCFNTLKAQLTWTDMKKILSPENSTKPSLPILKNIINFSWPEILNKWQQKA